jgi:glutathione S-transferase
MKLYYSPMTRAGRVRWLLEELAVPYELERMTLGDAGEAYLRVHPLGAVPALEDGEIVIHESGAIMIYLAEKYAEQKLLPPIGSRDRALCLQWLFFALTTVEPPVIDVFAEISQADETQRFMPNYESGVERFRDAAAVLENELASKEWLLGATFTIADIAMISLIAWTKAMNLLTDFPALQAYMKRGAARPANKRARAD